MHKASATCSTSCPSGCGLVACTPSCLWWVGRRWRLHDRDRLTRDVDAVFVPAPDVREIAEEIGANRAWSRTGSTMPRKDSSLGPMSILARVRVRVAARPGAIPAVSLAMKLHASRDERDLDDAAILFNDLGYTTAQECIDLLTARYPATQLLPRHRYVAEDVARRAGVGASGPRRANPTPSLSQSREASGPGRGLAPPESFGGPERPPGIDQPPPRRPGPDR